ncbi:MAG: Gfo/Idh/MocA family oxidoreductase, partial [Prevotella sp.]|nr:Gfo/Idh/MocA family oxidoreductase [Prevotella sp.]
MENLRVGIIGAGWIAEKAAITLKNLEGASCYAIASRSLEKAQAFAEKWQVTCSYGSYSELIADENVDLVYVATPHSHHYDVTKEALENGKPCLVEKAFMANHRQAVDIVRISRERKMFLAEAIRTRYQPAVQIVRQLISNGQIGTPRLITATLGYSMGNKPRIMRPDL